MSRKAQLIKAPGDFLSSGFPFHIAKFRHPAGEFSAKSGQVFQREFWKIIYVIEGEGRKLINGRLHPLKPGSLYLVHPEDLTSFEIDSPFIEIFNVLFLPSLVSFGIKEMGDSFSFFSIFRPHLDGALTEEHREQLYVLDSNREIEALIRRMEREYVHKEPHFQMLIRLQLLELLALILRRSERKIKGNRKKGVAAYIDSMIEAHFKDGFDFGRLAEEIGASKSHICRCYRKARGASIGERLLERRLSEARSALLSHQEKSVSEICYECGFNDLAYFYRAFAKAYGLNPGSYRKSFRLH